MKRINNWWQHCHFLKNSDWIKQNSVCHSLAVSKIVKSYAVIAVLQNLSTVNCSKKQLLLKKTENHWLSLKNCHNAETFYKKQNSDTQQWEDFKKWQQQQWKTEKWLNKKDWHSVNI